MKSEEIPGHEPVGMTDSPPVDADFVRRRIIDRVEVLDNERDRLQREYARSVAGGNLAQLRAYELAIQSQDMERLDLNLALVQLRINPQDAHKALKQLDGPSPASVERNEWRYLRALKYVGRNKRGVPIYEGDMETPRFRTCILMIAFGGFLIVITFALENWLSELSGAFRSVLEIALWAAGAFSVLEGVGGLIKRQQLADGVPLNQLSEQLGIPELTLLMEARQHGVDPRSIINGKEIFRLSDFGDGGILLRPAEPPAEIESSLLRPAAQGQTKPETLLRTVSSPASRDNERE